MAILGHLGHIGSFWVILVHFGPFWGIWGHRLAQERSEWSEIKLNHLIYGHFRPFGPFWVILGHFGPFWAIWAKNGPKYGHVGCPDRRNVMPWSYNMVAAHIGQPMLKKRWKMVKIAHFVNFSSEAALRSTKADWLGPPKGLIHQIGSN